MRTIRLQAIVVSDDDTPSIPGPVEPADAAAGLSWGGYVQKLVDDTNALYEHQNVAFRLHFDPDLDVSFVSGRMLNVDDKDPVEEQNGIPVYAHSFARQQVARRYPGRVVVFFRDFNADIYDHPEFSKGGAGDYVVFSKDLTAVKGKTGYSGNTLAHELGHYFHLPHTFFKEHPFYPDPDGIHTMQDVKESIKKYVKQGHGDPGQALEIFDGDLPLVDDTPPDPGIGPFAELYNNPHRCPGTGDKAFLEFIVDFQDSAIPNKCYTLAPDMSNLMSYFNVAKDERCPKQRTLSARQKAAMEAVLRTGNRNNLLHTAAMVSDNGKAYFFKDDRYIRFDIASNKADAGYPKQISDGWPGVWDNLDAAVVWPDGRTFFFRGDEYIKYDRASKKVVDGYPKKIGPHWTGIWDSGIDAVLIRSNQSAWFFRGRQCQEYDIVAGHATGPRQTIAGRWNGTGEGPIDAALKWPGDKIYFFRGDQYARYDIVSRSVDKEYQRIDGLWPGLWPSITAAVVWNDGFIRFVRGNEYIKYSILGDEAAEGFPKPLASKKPVWIGIDSFPNDWKQHGFDAAVVWNKDTAYFFKGGEYLRYNLNHKEVDGKPRPIGDGWNGLGNAPVDAVVLWDDGIAYFFRGDHYYRVKADTKSVIAGPLSIAEHWEGVFASDLDAVIALWDRGKRGKAYFFKNKQYIRYDIAKGKADTGPLEITQGIWPGLSWKPAPVSLAATSA